MNDPTRSNLTEAGAGTPPEGAMSAGRLAVVLRAEQRQRWQAGDRVPAGDSRAAYPVLRGDPGAALDLTFSGFLLRERRGGRPGAAEYRQRFPEYAAALSDQIELHGALAPDETVGRPRSGTPAGRAESA